ncbi:hypothetical protein [Flavobacterium haoranii]|uniref:hypothetical protein n=1 Tax=Flavobacterium haoranii TaxID=683124 RepID=UPI001266DEE6|nr:hypothetical protein [Flavobacterium haoranii]
MELSTGFDFLRATIDVALGNFDFDKYFNRLNNRFSGVCFLSGQQGKIVEIVDNSEEFLEVVYCESLSKIGDIVEGIVDGSDKRLGVIIYSSNTPKPIINPSKVLNIVINRYD